MKKVFEIKRKWKEKERNTGIGDESGKTRRNIMRKEIYRISQDKELTDAKLSQLIARHAAESTFRYKQLKDAYETDYSIFHEPKKPEWKRWNYIFRSDGSVYDL